MMGNNISHRKIKKNKCDKSSDQDKDKRGILICLKKDKATVKVVLLPPLGKLSHGSKVLPLFTLPLGSRVNFCGRQEPRGYRGDSPSSPSLPFPSAARRGGGDGDHQLRRILTMFFLVEAEKTGVNAEGDSTVAKNKIKNWYTIHPVGVRGPPGL
ncbi:Hypothetical predicted protein [Podarcis lilfordi]|uniref:Uncharacterized protein n=1 Tax=Podarcis lilfordi TaxID=74358 RepID=A0AA35KIA6_9SAUR|nr:Hypothetical predicted protein [Podarcis lilfordi]